MNIEALYTDNEFDDYLVFLAGKNYLEFDDLKQDTFLEMLDGENISNMSDAKRIARRVKERMKKKNTIDYHYQLSAIEDSHDDDSISVLWEDNHSL